MSKLSRIQRKEEAFGYLFCSPWIIGFLAFVIGPLVAAFYFSLTRWDLITPSVFIGLGNYRNLLVDPLFWQSLKVTSIYVVFTVPLGIVVGLCIALLLNQKIRGLSIYRTVYYFPAVLSGVAVSLMWLIVFNPDFGIVNYLLSLFGIKGPGWYASEHWALPTLIIISLWGAGGSMIIYLSGLQSIPTETYEAAEIDGAGAIKRFIHITVPMITPILFFSLVMNTISAFQAFNEAFLITGGGPLNATYLYGVLVYNHAFKFSQMGYASALAWVLFLVVLLVTMVIFLTSKYWVFYAEGGENTNVF